MSEAIKIFRDLFFLGHLPPIRFKWNDQLVKSAEEYGHCTPPDTNTGETLIEMDPFIVYPDANGRTASLIGTLLHELVHAFLQYWPCDGTLCPELHCAAKHYLPLGQVEHGPAWQMLAAAIEMRCTTWLGFPVRLNRKASALKHVMGYKVAPFEHEADLQYCFPGNTQEAMAFRGHVTRLAVDGFGKTR